MTTEMSELLHPRRSIAGRVMLLVTVGTLTTLGLLGLASWSELRRADASIVREHQAVAAGAARQFDDQLAEVLSQLQSLANDTRALEPLDQHAAQLDQRALTAWQAAERLDGIFVATLDGVVRIRVPAGRVLDRENVDYAVGRVAYTPRPAVTSLLESHGRGAPLLVIVPMRSWQGDLLGVVVGEMNPAGRRFMQLTSVLSTAPLGELELVDDQGHVLSQGGARRATRATTPVIASVRLNLAPWHVVSHRADDALAPEARLATLLIWLGPLLVGGSLLLAWGAAWSVRRPLLALTGAAERLTAGDLATPVAITGLDEVGQLGRAFETMRQALEASHLEIEAANAVLEERVAERTRELERLNRELRERERARQSLLRKVITAQEDERKRIARELHDEACQTVTALGLRLESALAGVPEQAEAHAALTRARELAARSLDELHRLMHDLRPALLDDLGLVAAIRWYVDRLARKGFAVRFESTRTSLGLPMEIRTAVFRAVQEALTNVERHSQAEMVLVQLSVDNGELLIDIEDDGVGFDPASLTLVPEQGRGLGLLGMRERLELAGGVAEIQSSPGQGTHVVIRVPLPEGAADAEDPGADRR